MDEAGQVLAELRTARRRRRTARIDTFEAFYRAYLTALGLGLAVLFLSNLTGDTRLRPATLASIRTHGPAIVGLALALAVAVGLRSGGRGGPLVIEAADVRHVLMAPIDRGLSLKGPAVRQVRFALLIGAVTGGVGGLLAFRRLPGVPGAWLACEVTVGAVGAATAVASAMVVSGRRWSRLRAGVLALAIVAWSAADAALSWRTSPVTLVGEIALWPLRFRPAGLVGLVGLLVAAAVIIIGLRGVAGTSLEASERRASLVGQLRFAATLQDVRAVIVLRRQLALERPRARPWFRLRPVGVRLPVWRRCWHGILRWPGARLVRLVLLATIAGLAGVGAWRGTTPLIVVAGLALYVAALDAVEPLAQEIDHPDRSDSYPRPAGALHLRQLAAPAVVMVGVGAIAGLAGYLATGLALRALVVAGVLIVPASLVALSGAAVSVVKGPPPPLSPQQWMSLETAGIRLAGRLIWPPMLAVLGLLPLLAGRSATHPVPVVAAAGTGVVIVVAFAAAWVRFEADAHAWWTKTVASALWAPSSSPKG